MSASKVLPKAIEDIAQGIEAKRDELISALRGLTAHQTMRSPADGEWNAAQVVDHLLLAEGFTSDITAMLVNKAHAEGEAAGFPADLDAFEPLPPPISLEAPPPIRPRQELPAEELITSLNDMKARSQASLELLITVDPRNLKMAHPLFGELDLGQWWLVHPMHYEMHITQAQAALSGN